jgi:hypothetical protein
MIMASTNIYGTIIEVATANTGANVTANTAIGATVLPVDDPTVFDENGGNLMVNLDDARIYAYTGISEAASTVLLAVTLDIAIDEDDRVDIWPPAPVKTALVDLNVEESDPILVTVPHAISATLADGMRPENLQESVLLQDRSVGELYIADVQASVPLIDSGVQTSVVDIITAASGWSVTSANLRRIGKIINIQFNVTRTGSAITVPASGNITNTVVGTVVEEWRPWVPHSQIGLCSGRTGPMCVYSISGTTDGNGDVTLCAIEAATGTIATNDALSCGGTYFQA